MYIVCKYNSTTGGFEGYTTEWGAIAGSGSGASGSAVDQNTFTGDGSTTAFTLAEAPTGEDNTIVFIDGVYQDDSTYSVSGTTLTFSTAPANSRVITVYTITSGILGTAPSIDTMTGDGSDTTLTLSISPANENSTFVTIDGVVQHKDTYSVSGTTLTFSAAPPNGSAVECISFANTTVTTTKLIQDADEDTKIQVEESSDEDKIRFDIAGTEEMVMDATGIVINDGSNDRDFRIESNGNANMLFVDGGNDRVGIGTSSPSTPLDVVGSTGLRVNEDGSGTKVIGLRSDFAGVGPAVNVSSNHPLLLMTNNTERMRIDSSGTVAIGTTPSVHKFTVSDNTTGVLAANFVNSHSGGYGVNISAGNGTQYALRAENYAGGTLWQINGNGNMCHGFTSAVDGANYSTYSNNSNGIAIGSGAGSNQYRRIYHSASSGILTFKSSSNSPYLSNAGAWTNASDRAYKENIEDIEYGLSTVEALQPRKFDMIDDGSHEIGFIAQEVEELIPEVVIGEEGTKGVGYGQLTAVLTKAIQELKAELDAAKERITELENS